MKSKKLIILLVIFFLILIYYYYIYDDCHPLDTSYINKDPLKCCILLTMYIGGNDKKRKIYLHRINRWLNETSFDIYTVESSGELLNINHPRLKQFTFLQGDKHKGNSTILERNSILKAYNYFQNDFKKYDIIFKITAKYFIPSLESLIKHIKPDTELLVQNIHKNILNIINVQNTEITGYRTNIIYDITSGINNTNSYEFQIAEIKNKYKTYRLPHLKLEDFTERAHGDILTYL